MNIHERLKFLRSQLGLTTRAFGKSINLSGSVITNMEKGRRNITERTIKDICREYDVNSDWLINGNEPMFNDALDGLDLADDVKELVGYYLLLLESDKALVKHLIQSLTEKASVSKNK